MKNRSNINKNFIPYDLALKLKELGFYEKCFNVYDELGFIQDEKEMDELNLIKLKAPLWQQVFDFFRKEHNLLSFIDIDNSYRIYWDDIKHDLDLDSEIFNTYEEARLKCLEKLIELCAKK